MHTRYMHGVVTYYPTHTIARVVCSHLCILVLRGVSNPAPLLLNRTSLCLSSQFVELNQLVLWLPSQFGSRKWRAGRRGRDTRLLTADGCVAVCACWRFFALFMLPAPAAPLGAFTVTLCTLALARSSRVLPRL